MKLQMICIPATVKEIGKNAFNGCKKLKTITFKGTNINKIGKNAFSAINNKVIFKIPAKKIKPYTKLIKAAGAPAKAEYTK